MKDSSNRGRRWLLLLEEGLKMAGTVSVFNLVPGEYIHRRFTATSKGLVGNLFSQEGGIRWKERLRRESLCPVSRCAAAGVVVASHEGVWDGVRSLLYTRRGSDLRDQ